MKKLSEILLKKGRENSVLRKHLWIFSGAISKVTGNPANGDLVEVKSFNGNFLAFGHYQDHGSITVRVLSFDRTESTKILWTKKFKSALSIRQACGLIYSRNTNCYRLIHGEGDGLPGLIIDIYGNNAVIQTHSAGMAQNADEIADCLLSVYENKLDTIYITDPANKTGIFKIGSKESSIVIENGLKFNVDWTQGQKTGFFLDQRENRELLTHYSREKFILNLYSYSGGFSAYALAGEAKHVTSVDSSEYAIQMANQNITLNFGQNSAHSGIKSDVVEYLNNMEDQKNDLIILDPPAFAKHKSASHNAIQAYKRINKIAMDKIKKRGILFTFSCSQVIDKTLFRNTIYSAALEANRDIRILHQLSQPPDHPVNLMHPESEYLKGLILFVS